MTERTFNIIMCCKGKLYPEVDSCIARIKMYIAKECKCSVDDYGPIELQTILQEAVLDYIDSCDKPSAFLRSICDNKVPNLPLSLVICKAFKLVKVIDENGNYINGFNEALYDTLLQEEVI